MNFHEFSTAGVSPGKGVQCFQDLIKPSSRSQELAAVVKPWSWLNGRSRRITKLSGKNAWSQHVGTSGNQYKLIIIYIYMCVCNSEFWIVNFRTNIYRILLQFLPQRNYLTHYVSRNMKSNRVGWTVKFSSDRPAFESPSLLRLPPCEKVCDQPAWNRRHHIFSWTCIRTSQLLAASFKCW